MLLSVIWGCVTMAAVQDPRALATRSRILSGAQPLARVLGVPAVLASPLASNFLAFYVGVGFDARVVAALVMGLAGLLGFLTLGLRALGDYRSRAPLLLGSSFFVFYMVLGSMLGGLGKSPYAFTPTGILYNVVVITSLIVAEELVRTSVIWRLKGRPFAGITLAALLIMLAYLTPVRMQQALDPASTTSFVVWAVSLLSVHMLAGLVVYHSGLAGGIAFRAPIAVLGVITPVLPNITGGLAILTYILTAIAVSVLIVYSIGNSGNGNSLRSSGGFSLGDKVSILSALALVLLIWMSHGFLGFYAFVVVSYSMAPEIVRGDIVIVKEASIGEVSVGDVVLYIGSEGPVVHRVVEKSTDSEGRPVLITKGDANEDIDPYPVTDEMLVGRMVAVIPELGNITIWLRAMLSTMLGAA